MAEYSGRIPASNFYPSLRRRPLIGSRLLSAGALTTIRCPARILPVKAIEKTAKSSHKYRQIAASIREIGLVEPPVVIRDARDTNSYLLLDGHLRIEVLRDLEIGCAGLHFQHKRV